MASQQPVSRQWFRLPSVVRPVLPPTQTPEPPPPMARPAFRPMGPQPQPTQPPEPTPAPTFVSGVSSVPSSPIKRTSVPSPPTQKTSPISTVLPATTNTSPIKRTSVPSSPIQRTSAPSSPIQKSDTSASLISSQKQSPSPPKPSTSSMTTSPARPVLTSPSKLVPTSPARPMLTSPPKPETTAVVQTVMPRPSPNQSPRTLKPAVHSPPESPKTKPTAPPPSPLILPPPQLNSKVETEPKIPAETEQKTVLFQTTTEKPKSWLNGTGHLNDFDERYHGKHELSKDIFGKMQKGHHKKFSSDSDEPGMRVITIAGENKGAFMEVVSSTMKHKNGNSHTLHPQIETKWHCFSGSSSSSEEGNSKKKDKNKKGKAMNSPPLGAFTNSNVQGVNSSILFNSSFSHHDPGVHLSLSRKPTGPGIHVQDKTNGYYS